MAEPIRCVWKGKAFHPYDARTFRDVAARYGEGEVVVLDDAKPRSKVSHDHFFALVAEAHETLPEHLAARFPTPDSLRHYALCKARYCDVDTFVASSKAEAMRLVSFVRTGAQAGVQVVCDGPTVTRLTPHSQSLKAMGGKVFQESKSACLEVIADMLETTVAAMAVAA